MEGILEVQIGETENSDREANQMKEGVLRRGFCGNNSEEGVAMETKIKQRSEKEPRREHMVFNLDMRGKGRVGASKVKDVVPYSRSKMKGIVVCGGSHEVKRSQLDLFEQLHVKLRLLEEDTRIMKKVVFGCMEERAIMMSEITQQFHIVREHLISLGIGESSLRVPSSFNPHKEINKIIGLCEVLHQDSNPPIVTRDVKVNLDASLDLLRMLQVIHEGADTIH